MIHDFVAYVLGVPNFTQLLGTVQGLTDLNRQAGWSQHITFSLADVNLPVLRGILQCIQIKVAMFSQITKKESMYCN